MILLLPLGGKFFIELTAQLNDGFKTITLSTVR